MGALIIWAYLFINYSSVGWQCLYCGWTNGYARGQPGIMCWVEVAQLALISIKNPHQSCLLIVYTRLSCFINWCLVLPRDKFLAERAALGLPRFLGFIFLFPWYLFPGLAGPGRRHKERQTLHVHTWGVEVAAVGILSPVPDQLENLFALCMSHLFLMPYLMLSVCVISEFWIWWLINWMQVFGCTNFQVLGSFCSVLATTYVDSSGLNNHGAQKEAWT